MAKTLPKWIDDFNLASLKGTPVDADLVLIDDSADSWTKKYATLASIKANSFVIDAIGEADDESITFVNTTAATDILNQWSPGIYAKGSAWKTGVGAGAQDVEARVQLRTFDGNPPTAKYVTSLRVNGVSGSWLDVASFNLVGSEVSLNVGNIIAGGGINVSNVGPYLGITSFHTGIIGTQGYFRTNRTTDVTLITSKKSAGAGASGNFVGWQAGTDIEPVGHIESMGWVSTGNAYRETFRFHGSSAFEMVHALDSSKLGIYPIDELLTIGSGGTTTDTSGTIAAGSRLWFVTAKVVVAPPGTATFNLGSVSSPTLFATGVSSVLGTSDIGDDAFGTAMASTEAIRVTMNTTPSDATGRIRISGWYLTPTPSTT